MRRVLRQVHLWIGLVAGLVLVALGLSGSALVFRADLERFAARDWLESAPAGAPRPLDELVAAARAVEPARSVARLHWPTGPAGTLEVVTQAPGARNLVEARLASVYVDPASAAVLGVRDRSDGAIWWLQELHYSLFGGERGLAVNGGFALALLLLAVSGPILWWPGWRRRRDALRIRRRPAAAFWRDLHAVGGAVACVALALFAITAMYYTWRAPATALVASLAGDAPLRPPVAEAADGEPASLDALLAAARAAMPDAHIDEFRPPRGASGPASASFRLPGDSVPGRHRLYLHPVTATVLRIDLYDSLPRSSRWMGAIGPLHFGTFAGRASQWAWFVAGLAPALLFATGGWLWWRNRRRGAVPAARRQ
jgi:uncharacterized iron-regulated membrane protein